MQSQRKSKPLPIKTDKAVLDLMIEQLVTQWPEVRELRDISGAGLIHCLVLANNKDSLSLAMRLFHINPRLLLCVHEEGGGETAGKFKGEGSLHILAVNCCEDEFNDLLRVSANRR